MSYKRIDEVTEVIDGVPTTLTLQLRSDLGSQPWYALSWRSRYPGQTASRRFYWSSKTGPWTTPSDRALAILDEADRRGMLSEEYDSSHEGHRPDRVRFAVSDDLDDARRRRLLDEIICLEEELLWGANPFYVVSLHEGFPWRSVMLVSEDRMLATFRSTTTDVPRSAVKRMRPRSEWWLYNIMPDMGTDVGQRFRAELDRVLSRRPLPGRQPQRRS